MEALFISERVLQPDFPGIRLDLVDYPEARPRQPEERALGHRIRGAQADVGVEAVVPLLDGPDGARQRDIRPPGEHSGARVQPEALDEGLEYRADIHACRVRLERQHAAE